LNRLTNPHITNIFLAISACLAAIPAFAQAPLVGNCGVLPANDIWNTPIDQLPVSAASPTWVTTIGASSPVHPDFGSGLYGGAPIGIPFVTVPGTQTKYPAIFTYADESDPGPYAIPLGAPIEGGSQSTGDRHAIAIDVTNCILYELYAAYPQASSWTAGSGAIFNLASNALRPAGWTSTDAAGLPVFPGLLRYDEIAAGEIRHAIRFTVPQTQKAYVWPARHYASSLTDPKYPPMGARFRLKANFDISGFSPANQIILRALKKYGMMLADNGSSWYLSGSPDSHWDNNDLHNLTTITGASFEAVNVSPLMIDPNSGQALQSGVSVSVAPAAANVTLNLSQQFTATVQNSTDQTVSWSVNGVPGGTASSGSIGAAGLYTAPSIMPSPATVIVEAASNSTPSAFGTASVTLLPVVTVTVTISPLQATVITGRTQRFTAKVQGTTNQTVTWKVNGITSGNSTLGTIGASGLYTAPNSVPSGGSVTVTAVSKAAPTVSAHATVSIVRRH
jgi:hypothetical protein